MKVIVYSRSDLMLILRRGIYADTHRHHAIQITFAVGEPFEAVLDQKAAQHWAVVIDSDYPHRVVGQDEWVITLLLNPETTLAKSVQRYILTDRAYQSLDVQLTHNILRANLESDFNCGEIDPFLSHVSDLILPKYREAMLPDSRIGQVLDIVGQLPEYKIAARELSKKVYLSESRLGHLFKEEIGIPLRRYLLWCRLSLASRIIAQGENFTFAAHETGFTDSAHLSRTFYAMFGLRLSDMFGDRDLIRVVFCD